MDYFNPAAFNPKNTWTPGPLSSGMLYGQDRGNYNQLMDMFKSGQATDLAKKQAEFQDYNLSSPVREARRLGDIGLAQKNQFTALPRAQADLQSIMLQNQKTEATMESDVASTIAKNVQGKSEDELKTILNGLKKAVALQGEAEATPGYTGNGPLPLSVSSKLNPKEDIGIVLSKNPQRASELLKQFAEVDPTYIREMATGKLRNEGTLAVAKETASAHRYSADVMDRSRKAIEKDKAELKRELLKVDQQIQLLRTKVAKGEAKDWEKRLLQYSEQSAIALRQAQAGATIGYGAAVTGLQPGAVPKPPGIETLEPGTPTQTRMFSSKDEARAAIKSGLLKKGDKVKVGNEEFTVGEVP